MLVKGEREGGGRETEALSKESIILSLEEWLERLDFHGTLGGAQPRK